MPDRDDLGLAELKRLAQALKIQVANDLRKGEASAADVDRVARIEVRIATLEQFLRLRELTRQPGLAPIPSTTKGKKPRATRSKTKAD